MNLCQLLADSLKDKCENNFKPKDWNITFNPEEIGSDTIAFPLRINIDTKTVEGRPDLKLTVDDRNIHISKA